MSDTPRQSAMHDAVIEIVSELGVADPTITATVVLTRDRFYAGHRFFFDGIQVVWLLDDNVVHVYDDDATLIKTVRLGPPPAVDKAA